MSAVREVESVFKIVLRPSRRFHDVIPELLLQYEDDRSRACDLWKHFRNTVNDVYRTARGINRNCQNIALNIGIENACNEITRRLINANVHYEHNGDKGERSLKIHGLSRIPDEVLNADQYLVATIPEREREAEAQFIRLAPNETSQAASSLSDGTAVPMVEVVDVSPARCAALSHGPPVVQIVQAECALVPSA